MILNGYEFFMTISVVEFYTIQLRLSSNSIKSRFHYIPFNLSGLVFLAPLDSMVTMIVAGA